MTGTRAHVLLYGVDFCNIRHENQFWQKIIEGAGIDAAPISKHFTHPILVVEHNQYPRRVNERHIRESPSMLVRVEPPSVNPYQYSAKVTGLYDRVLTPTKESALTEHEDIYDLTLLNNSYRGSPKVPELEEWSQRQFDLAMVLRPNVSFAPTSLYHWRGRLVNELASSGMKTVYAGPNWDESFLMRQRRIGVAAVQALAGQGGFSPRRHPRVQQNENVRYLGKVLSSTEVYQKARFSVIVENDSSYVSEKMFDSLSSGCIPIYMGKPLKMSDPLSNFVVDARTEINVPQLVNSATNRHLRDGIFQKLHSYSEWLSAEASQLWTVDAYSKRLSAKISNNILRLLV